MDIVSQTLLYAKAIKLAFVVLTLLALTAYKYPASTDVEDGDIYDYIVVGLGSAGCIILNRLTEVKGLDVLGIEAGGDPPFESNIPAVFAFLVKTYYDWNYTAKYDGNPYQYRRNKKVDLPSGKVLGGSSTIHHFYVTRGDSSDYDDWVNSTGDISWSFKNLLPYFKKSENYQAEDKYHPDILRYHGTDGYTGITKENRNLPLKYLKAFQEVGQEVVSDVNNGRAKGFTRPMLYISKKRVRQSSAESFISRFKNRPGLYIKKNTLVIKILIDDKKRAIGVKCLDARGRIFNVYARKEIILSAGAFNSPKILLSSGVGPKDHLENMGVPVIVDSPVGETLRDHVAIILAHKLEATNDTAVIDPYQFPVPTFVGFGALDKTKNTSDYLTFNLICRNNPTALMQLSTLVYSLHEDIATQLYEAGVGNEVLFTVLDKVRPRSVGTVRLGSLNPLDPPKIMPNYLLDVIDLDDSVAYIVDFIRVRKSTYFKKVGGEILRFDIPKCRDLEWGTIEYWKCFILSIRDTTFDYCCSCPMGTVLDAKLRVRGIRNLRVVDASAMPNITSSKINAAVMALAEKAADLIKEDLMKEDREKLYKY